MNKVYYILIFVIMYAESFAQISKDSVQAMFPVGNIVSFKDNIACYRLKGIKDGGMYGFCKFDPNYHPNLTASMTSWEMGKGERSIILNSQCYTFIAPIFDYALPFNDGWAPVCINKKWTYVSPEGEYLCDFSLDAAYPFKGGKAKVSFEGNSYEINCKGEGLPSIIERDTDDLSLELKAETINQLCSEAQYEKAIEEGQKTYEKMAYVQDCMQPEMSDRCLANIVRIAFGIMNAQNQLMSTTSAHYPDLFHRYRALSVDKFVSFESRHPAINRYNAGSYFLYFIDKYNKEGFDIINEINRKDYKSAIVKFEKWIKNNNISLKDDCQLLMFYYYLAELSDDFETANTLLIDISSNYANNRMNSVINEEAMCVILADIKKYQSAECLFKNKVKKITGLKCDERLFCLYYNLALMYKSAKSYEKSIDCLKQALQNKLPGNMEDIRLECMSELLNLQLDAEIIDDDLLKQYVDAEREYCITLFETEHTIVLNRLWGNSIQRMQRVLSHLNSCTDQTYLKSAFALTVFQQGITLDVEKYMSKTIFGVGDVDNMRLYNQFIERKSKFKGIDVFDLISVEDSDRENIYELYDLEKCIKENIRKKSHYIPIDIYNNFDSCNLNLVDIIQYPDSNGLYWDGAFVKTTEGFLSYIPLSIHDEFSSEDFWDKINLAKHFNQQDDIYVYYGVLDTHGLEYTNYDTRNPFCNYRLHRSSSLANVMANRNIQPNNNVMLYGGLDYGDNIVAQERGASKGYLENSKVEIDQIAEILANSDMDIDVQIKTEDEGTIKAFQQLSGASPKILHLATHGFSCPRQHLYNTMEDRFNYYRQNSNIQQQEWLMNNTGLLMSLDDNEENVLYANTVATCDLSKTELVVLSACSTMYGNDSDGIMQTIGLTTAFSFTGAKNIITSLQDVDDEMSCQFMVAFYKFLTESDSIYDSFRKTVMLMSEKYPQSPSYWNSFVLVEN